MRKYFYLLTVVSLILLCAIPSCNTELEEVEEQARIENTLKSVSFFQDTVGYDPNLLLEGFDKANKAIAEIGYPDAGYKLWIIQKESADVRFLVEGYWPNQDVYNEIHDNQLYKDAMNSEAFVGLESVGYYRFNMVK